MSKPACVPNMCDGCQRGLPIDENGNHVGKYPNGQRELQTCTKKRYTAAVKP